MIFPVGAKTSMLVYATGNAADTLRRHPKLDRDATSQLAHCLFPRDQLVPIGDGDLSNTCPPDDELYIACFPGISIVAAKEFALDRPSKLPLHFLTAAGDKDLYLHAMHSVVDWFACAHWRNGALVRSLSLSPDSGIVEDVGPRLPFEDPFWRGQYSPADNSPLELAQAALKEFFGYQLEGPIDASLVDPESIPLIKFRRSRSWWRFW